MPREETKVPSRAIPWTWVAIVVASVAIVYLSSSFYWFKKNEHVAIWLEGVALVLIFGLDLINRKEEHQETIDQLKAANAQAKATQDAAIEAKNSSDILSSLHRPLMGIERPIRVADMHTRAWKMIVVAKNFGTLLATKVSVTAEIFVDGELRKTDPVGEIVEVFPGQTFEHPIMFDPGERGRVLIHSGAQALALKINFTYGDQSQRRFVYAADAKLVGGSLDLTRTETTAISS